MADLDQQAIELNDIIRNVSPTVFELLSDRGRAIYYPRKGILAQGAAARGKEINATIGTAYEDDGSPMVLSSIARGLSLETRDAFPYAPSEGIKALRDKWQELLKSKNPGLAGTEIGLPVVTCGVTNGLSMIGYMFVSNSDEVVLADLYWENYDLVFGSAYGAKLRFFNLFKNRTFDVDSFRRTVTSVGPGKRVVVLNFPNNPSGYSPSAAEADEIVSVLEGAALLGNKLVVVLDDSYFGLVFEDNVIRESLFSRLAHLHENILAVKADGITKEEYAWGLRVGFVTYATKNGSRQLYSALEDKTAGALRGNISNAPHLSQSLFLQALNSPSHEREKDENRRKIGERYVKVKQVLNDHPEYAQYFEALPFNSGYFMCVSLKGVNSDRVWQTLLGKYSTGVICYSEKNLLRIAFASTPMNKIEKLFANVYAACRDCSPQEIH